MDASSMGRLLGLVLCIAGCGRIAFDPRGDGGVVDDGGLPDAPALPLCLDDDFDDGDVSDWQNTMGEWTAQAGGPDGSTMLHNDVMRSFGVTHPALRAVRAAQISVDFRIEDPPDGDFYVHILAPDWNDPGADTKYRVAMYAAGSDNPTDSIRRTISPVNTPLMEVPARAGGNSWHRLHIEFPEDHAIRVALDGEPHMQGPPDAQISGPFDIVFAFYEEGAIDNVRVGCTRSGD